MPAHRASIVLLSLFACRSEQAPAKGSPAPAPTPTLAPVDEDQDGLTSSADCDDLDPDKGGPEEVGDDIDNDCDTLVDCRDDDLVDGSFEGLVTSAESEDFCAGYCTRSLTGDLSLSGGSWADLSQLACLIWVDGQIDIENNSALASLRGLDAVREVRGHVRVAGNPLLGSLEGLASLSETRGGLLIEGNAGMTSLDGLEIFTSIEGDLRITDNLSLSDVSALHDLTLVSGDVVITGNPQLADEAAQALVGEIDAIGGIVTLSGR